MLAITEGGNEVDYRWGLVYAVVVTIAASGVTLYLHRSQRSVRSGLVGGEIVKWMIDTGTTGGVAVAFAIGLVLQQTGNAQAAAYVDPIVVIVFSAIALVPPLRMGIGAFRELVPVSPPPTVADEVRRRVADLERDHRFIESFVRIGKMAGQLDVEVYFVVGDTTPAREVQAYDRIRRELEASIADLGYDQWLTVCFTADRTFALD